MELISRKEIAEVFGVSLLTVITWETKGIIEPETSRNKVILYDLPKVMSLLDKKIIEAKNEVNRLMIQKEKLFDKLTEF